MNAVEIEEALSNLALEPFDAAEFPFEFLAAFGNKDTALKRLRSGNNNASDVPGGVLQRNNLHIAVCAPDNSGGSVGASLNALRTSPATIKAKAKFILATDGQTLEAEDRLGGESIACAFQDFPNHFGFFLPLAGISTIKEIKDNPVDVRATGRLNKLYVELLRENPDWATDERRTDMNHFMARLVFCFFAEDTDIFNGEGLFTQTIEQMSERDGSNTHAVMSEIFRAMNTPIKARHPRRSEFIPTGDVGLKPDLPLRSWADQFPYVNGGLFSGSTEVPRFTRMARTYLLHTGGLNWKKINPDIFGSMIQAVADDEERGALGMHYTSVPNILKVLNPLFLDDLHAQLNEAADNERKLLNLRRRMALIRVFDPACGSGNFLVIAYKQMRGIEAVINQRRSEPHLRSGILLTNFRGIELREFPADIARLALIIAEFQCDVLYRGQKDALAEFLPLNAQNWIVCHNALQLDWLSVCPPTGTGVRLTADDLFNTPLNQTEIDFQNEGAETYICGNPPYVWSNDQTPEQKNDLKNLFEKYLKSWKTLNYVSGWLIKATDYISITGARSALVSTNTICQGQQVSLLWPLIFQKYCEIGFAHTSFKWKNLAAKNAGVTVVVIGLRKISSSPCRIYSQEQDGSDFVKEVPGIGPYLVPGKAIIVSKLNNPMASLPSMSFGNKPVDGGNLLLSRSDLQKLGLNQELQFKLTRRIFGSAEVIDGLDRRCLWINDENLQLAMKNSAIEERIERVRELRKTSSDFGMQARDSRPHQFREMRSSKSLTIVMPAVSSENRDYLPATALPNDCVISNRCYGIYDGPLWSLALLTSRIHWVWISTVCGRLEMRFSYTNTLGWNTFPVPLLTEQNKADLTICAENILLAREAHFPATIADLYAPDDMPDNLRHAHQRNDEVLERIFIGRRFKNDTERLEKLFELYTKMTAAAKAKPTTKATKGKQAVGKGMNDSTDLAGCFTDFPLREENPASYSADVPRLNVHLNVEKEK